MKFRAIVKIYNFFVYNLLCFFCVYIIENNKQAKIRKMYFEDTVRNGKPVVQENNV